MSSKSKNVDTTKAVWDPSAPYQNLPRLQVVGAELESKAVLKQCITARAALAELKQAASLIPNQSMLISILPRLEAKASSEIENIVTTTDRLFQLDQYAADRADPATKEAHRYSQALLKGFEALYQHPLNTRTAELICGTIKGVEMRVRKVPGTALVHEQTGEVIYTPPEGEQLLRDLLADWERFLHQATDLDPLIRMAAAHYQFEAIHPFTDGNGRTGRVLNSLFLIQENLLTLPILYLSRYIIHRREDYYRLLLEVTRDHIWENWLLFIIKGVEESSRWTREKIGSIRSLQIHTADHVKAVLPKIYTHELIELIFELPYCRIQDLVKKEIAGRQAASQYLKELVRIGVLQEIPVGREKLFLHPKLMRLLSFDANAFEPYSQAKPAYESS